MTQERGIETSNCTPSIRHPYFFYSRNEEYHIQCVIGITSVELRVSVSHSQHECASWAEQIIGRDESPAFSVGPCITFCVYIRMAYAFR